MKTEAQDCTGGIMLPIMANIVAWIFFGVATWMVMS